MITKKVNKSSQLIFISPNYLKLSDSKPMIKKSLHLASPKASSKPTIRTVYKPLTTSKKSKQPSKHYQQEYASIGNRLTGSIGSSILHNSKIKTSCNATSKRSKSKLTVGEHLSTDLWRSSVYESLSKKEGMGGIGNAMDRDKEKGGDTYRRPMSIDMKCKGDTENNKNQEKQRQKQRCERMKSRDKMKGNRSSMGVQKEKGRREGNQDEKYEGLLNQTQLILKKYTGVIFKLKDEVKDLQEENLLLRRKLNIG